MKLLDRYVVRELLQPFLYGVGICLIVFMAYEPLPRALRIAEKQPWSTALEFLTSCVPIVLTFSIPVSALMACLLTFSRLAGNSEIVAMRASGIPFRRIALPGLLLTFCISLVAFYIADRILPYANYQQRELMLQYLKRDKDSLTKNIELSEVDADGTERVMLARRLDVEKKLLTSITIVFFKENRRFRVVLADQAAWNGRAWIMRGVHTQEIDTSGRVKSDSYSEKTTLPFDDDLETVRQHPPARDEMTRADLLRRVQVELATADGALDPLKNYYMVEYHRRLALPFSCIVFGLFGIPLAAAQSHRSSQAVGFGLALIFIGVYYSLMTFGCYLGEKGILPAAAGAWTANVVFGGVGIWLLARRDRA